MAVFDGAELHYDVRGSGPAVLFIHGSGDFGAMFERAASELRPSFRTIVYDRRGFAGSSRSEPGDLARHVEDAAALLRHLGAAPATVVGSSAGGVVAMGLAAAQPELVRALVLAEPTWQPAAVLTPSAARVLAAAYLRRFVLRDDRRAALGLYRWITTRRGGGNQFDESPRDWQRVAASHAAAALREVTQLIRPWPPKRSIRRIDRPVTLLIGDRGERLFHRTSERALRAMRGGRLVRVRDSAHLVALDQPRALARAAAEAAAPQEVRS